MTSGILSSRKHLFILQPTPELPVMPITEFFTVSDMQQAFDPKRVKEYYLMRQALEAHPSIKVGVFEDFSDEVFKAIASEECFIAVESTYLRELAKRFDAVNKLISLEQYIHVFMLGET